jgi:hypothetical protein
MAAEAKWMPSAIIYDTLAVANLATGGSLGTAATTVDIYGAITVNQTTAAQTNTLASPTVTSGSRFLTVANIGSTPFTFTGTGFSFSLVNATSCILFWTGAAWSKVA